MLGELTLSLSRFTLEATRFLQRLLLISFKHVSCSMPVSTVFVYIRALALHKKNYPMSSNKM
jgi:hypothetical protein